MADTEEEPGLRDYLAAARRRRKAMWITMAVCIASTALLALLLPPYFRSTGTILIEQQEVPQDLVRSTVTSYADQRVQVISQRVMTTQNLMDIIRRYDLYADRRERDSREEIIERMRDDIEFRMISADVVDPRSGVPRQATIAFSVSYTSRSAEKAVKVANELTTLYLNENLTERTRLARDATTFLQEESARLSNLIAELEARLAEFKSNNVDTLPELSALNMQLLDRTERELRDTEARLVSLQQQRVFLEAQLAQIAPHSVLTTETGERILSPADRLKALRTKLASAEALYAPTHPDVVRLRREIQGLEAQTGNVAATNDVLRELDAARGALAEARERYGAGHPDIERLERQVAALEAAAAVERQRPTSAPAHDNPDNPAYIQLQAQLAATENDQQALEGQVTQLRRQIADYERKITVAPQIEKEYRRLTRDYESAQLKYAEVRSKQMEAQLAQNLESDRKGERFTLIEPPLPPEEPVSPNRAAIAIIGVILTLGAGAGIVMLLEAVDSTVRGRRDVAQILEALPLAIVPRITTEREMRAGRLRLQLSAGAAVIAGAAIVLATHYLYRPLDVLWFVALRRLGL